MISYAACSKACPQCLQNEALKPETLISYTFTTTSAIYAKSETDVVNKSKTSSRITAIKPDITGFYAH